MAILKTIATIFLAPGLLLVLGFLFNRSLERFKREQGTVLEGVKGQETRIVEDVKAQLARSLEDHRHEQARALEHFKLQNAKQLETLDRQLSELYWPLRLCLEKDTALWRRLPALKPTGDLPEKLAEQLEQNYILTNHRRAVEIIESKIHLAGDSDVVELLERYVRHVAIYQNLRSLDISDQTPKELGEPFPETLVSVIRTRTEELQKEYNHHLHQPSV